MLSSVSRPTVVTAIMLLCVEPHGRDRNCWCRMHGPQHQPENKVYIYGYHSENTPPVMNYVRWCFPHNTARNNYLLTITAWYEGVILCRFLLQRTTWPSVRSVAIRQKPDCGFMIHEVTKKLFLQTCRADARCTHGPFMHREACCMNPPISQSWRNRLQTVKLNNTTRAPRQLGHHSLWWTL